MTVVYLAGPINGCSDDEAHGWRQGFMASLPSFGFLDPMRRDYRGKEDESVTEIVEGDIADIDACDVFLAYCWQTSWGTAMEIFYAHRSGKTVLLVVPEGHRVSPWLRHHSTAIVPDLASAAAWLAESGEGQAAPSSADYQDTCPLCDGTGCEEGCGQNGGCLDAYSGPSSHKVCPRCHGSGTAPIDDDLAADLDDLAKRRVWPTGTDR